MLLFLNRRVVQIVLKLTMPFDYEKRK